MSGASGGRTFVTSHTWLDVPRQDRANGVERVRIFAVYKDGEFKGFIGSPHSVDPMDFLAMQIDWPEREESIEEYIERKGL